MIEIELVPAGYRHILILIAVVKRALLSRGIKSADKLQFLENLESLPDNYIAPEMIEMVEPLNDAGYAIYAEAKSLDPPGDKTGKASFAVLTGQRVFGHFLNLNPSILAAIEWREANRGRAILAPVAARAPQPAPPPASPPVLRPSYGSENIPDRFMQGGAR